MSGGSLNESIIIDVTRYMHGIKMLNKHRAVVLPGTFIVILKLKRLRLMLFYRATPLLKNLCVLGGMVGNNSGGEKPYNTARWRITLIRSRLFSLMVMNI